MAGSIKSLPGYRPVAALHIAPDGKIQFANERARELFGYSEEELAGLRIPDIDPDVTGDSLRDSFRELPAEGPSMFRRRLRRRDGSVFPALVVCEFREIGDGACGYVVALIHDLSAEEQMERDREALEEQLRQSQKWETVGRLAGGIAHEYNNMLAVILGYAELMQARLPDDDPMRKFVREIEKAGGRARDITNQLLAFSRRQPIAPRIVDLNGLVGDGLRTLGRMMAERIRIDFTPGDDLWEIKIDPAQFDKILLNLAVNAQDAMPGGGRMTIKTGNVRLDAPQLRGGFSMPPGEYVRLTVSDEGIGMDRETFSHLFEPFYSTKGVGKGTGLGLPTVYGIVKQNGGYIEADSAPGKGTAFRIFFPRAKEIPAAAEAPAPSAAGTVGPGKSILLVEDEEMVRMMVTRQLEDLGYRVACAGSPAEALSFFGRPGFAVDLLVSDVAMPGMSGPDLWKRVKGLRPEAKVLFISAYSPGSAASPGIFEEGARFLGKPFTRTGLAEAVRKAFLDR